MSGHIATPTQPSRLSDSDSLTATVAKVLSSSDDGTWVRFQDNNGTSYYAASGAEEIEEGETYKFLGSFQEHKKYGRRFEVTTFMPSVNGGRAGLVKYLVQLCPGIGQVRAERIWEECEGNAIKWLREWPMDFVEEKLLPEDVALHASELLRRDERNQQVKIDLFGMFAGRGLGNAAINRCIATWGERAAFVVGRNPWQLLLKQIPGAGWKRVDKLYLDRGGDPYALKRQAIAGWYALNQSPSGSTWLPISAFDRGVIEQVGSAKSNREGALNLAVRSGLVEIMTEWEPGRYCADPDIAAAERGLALAIANLNRGDGASFLFVEPSGLSDHQEKTIDQAVRTPVLLLTGTPGTGKTYAASRMIKIWAKENGASGICVCAPTGKAAVRIQENLTRHGLQLEATTIHRLLGISRNGRDGRGWGFQHDASNPLDCRLLVVDEFSMCDTSLACSLFSALRPGTHVLIVGDPYQLPPVGPGCPLRDLIRAGLPNAHLTEIKRNAGTITTACAAIKDGKAPTLDARLDAETGHNLKLIACDDERLALKHIQDVLLALRAKPDVNVIWDCQVLTPLNNNGKVSRKPLNDFLQNLLNPVQPSDPKCKQTTFRLRDKVICLSNTRETAQRLDPRKDVWRAESWSEVVPTLTEPREVFIANGELGRVIAVSSTKQDVVMEFSEPTRRIKVKAGNRVQHEDGSDSAREDGFALGYAITVHKSQGSEWPHVICVIDPSADRVSSRELIYTAISRARTWCMLIGSERVLRRQIGRAELPGRKTFLREYLECEINRKG